MTYYTAGQKTILRIAVAAPVYGLFDYLLPAQTAPDCLERGLRLWIPFGKGERLGVLWEVASETQCAESILKPALRWLDKCSLWSTRDLELLAWIANYYKYPLGVVLELALPHALRGNKVSTKIELKCNDHIGIGVEGVSIIGEGVGEFHKGEDKSPWGSWGGGGPHLQIVTGCKPNLNADQANVLAVVRANLGQFKCFLLEGITSSGKTEIYLHAIEDILARNKQALVLVPEIGLVPQMQKHLQQRFGTGVVLLHSSCKEQIRLKGWLAAQAGFAQIVIGTRLAIFTPMPRLGLIVVDEEHDLSFKQQDGLRYSARDVAVWRGRQCGCTVILGSATPSLESLQNVIWGRYTKLSLSVRVGGGSSPHIDLIDVRSVHLKAGLSPILIELLRKNIACGQQSLLFLNRRGYAPVVTCYNCGWTATCVQCNARFTLHLQDEMLWCHHCGSRKPQIIQCPNCDKSKLKLLGQGTQRIEQVLHELLGDITVARIDRDTTRHSGSLELLLRDATAGVPQILLGTQMLGKGHHFPEVTLVGIVDADHGLYGADFRATERMAQLVVQVAGRAGRGSKPGRVVLQTRHPDHPLLQALIHHGYNAFANLALQERQQAQLPPFSAQALLRAESPDAAAATTFLNSVVAQSSMLPAGLEFWGPAPAPMERRAGRYRYNLLVQASDRASLQKFLYSWLPQVHSLSTPRQLRWSLDIDPQEVL